MSARIRTEIDREMAPRVAVRVIERRMVARTILAVVQLLDGEPTVGMILESPGGRRWEVRGLSFAPLPSLESGRRGLLLAPVLHDRELALGEDLYATA